MLRSISNDWLSFRLVITVVTTEKEAVFFSSVLRNWLKWGCYKLYKAPYLQMVSPRVYLHVVGMLWFMSAINQQSLPTSFYSGFCVCVCVCVCMYVCVCVCVCMWVCVCLSVCVYVQTALFKPWGLVCHKPCPPPHSRGMGCVRRDRLQTDHSKLRILLYFVFVLFLLSKSRPLSHCILLTTATLKKKKKKKRTLRDNTSSLLYIQQIHPFTMCHLIP